MEVGNIYYESTIPFSSCFGNINYDSIRFFDSNKIFLDNTKFMSIVSTTMSRRCEHCGKKALTGSSISRRGLPKKKGGIGLKTTGITKRKFFPNLQPKRIVINGKIKKVSVCAKCIKSGQLLIPTQKSPVSTNS